MNLFGFLDKTLNIPLLSKYFFVLKAVLNICSLASIFLLVSMLGPAELNWPVELRVWLMPVVYGFAAYGFTGLVLAYFNYLFVTVQVFCVGSQPVRTRSPAQPNSANR